MPNRIITLATCEEAATITFAGEGCTFSTRGRMALGNITIERELRVDHTNATLAQVIAQELANVKVRRTQATARMSIDTVRAMLEIPDSPNGVIGGTGPNSGDPLYIAGKPDSFPLFAAGYTMDRRIVSAAEQEAAIVAKTRKALLEGGESAMLEYLGITAEEYAAASQAKAKK